MHCPKCGISINLETTNELLSCSCNFIRPKVWWEALQLDIDTNIKFEEQVELEKEIPEELTGYCESPWAD